MADFDSATYVSQLEMILERFDWLTFSSHKAAIKSVVLPQHFLGPHSEGYHINNLITYRVIALKRSAMKTLIGSDHLEAYFIWGKEVESEAERRLVGKSTFEKYGDADFRQLLIAHALAAVRYRVLQNLRFFPKAKLRTVVSAYCDETLPAAHRQQLFQKKSEIPRKIHANPFLLDTHILLLLLDMARNDGCEVEDMMPYLIS